MEENQSIQNYCNKSLAMKIIIFVPFFSVLFGCGQSNKPQDNDNFFNRIVNDFSRSSYFIVLRADLPDTTSEYLIENDDLFFFFHQKQGWNENDYRTKVLPFLEGKEKLKINKSDIGTYHFNDIKTNRQLEEDAHKGKDFFISKYFSNKAIKENIPDDERNFIIKTLYAWKVASKIDDESGYLIMESFS
jgi:hypothetical protein